MNKESAYHVLAYYFFTRIEDPVAEVARHQEFLKDKDVCCRVYISEEGINGQMSASGKASREYQEWLKQDPRFADVVFKIHPYHEHAFPRMTVKYRKQLVAVDTPFDMALTGKHLEPGDWKKMLQERDADTVILDVRNDYEWAIGHFEGAELPQLETFRKFPAYARQLKETRDPKKTRVMMYCTGGIRCEIYSAIMKQEGFDEVYQLNGGVIGYGLEMGHDLWKGKLFVFDDRLSVPIDAEEGEVISHCHDCGTLTDTYYNCANMDCNALFLSCPTCAEKTKGCCSESCVQAPRVRSYEKEQRPKPFRRHHLCSCGVKQEVASPS